MKSIYNHIDNQEIIKRIQRLSSDTKPQWGNLTADNLCKQSLLELDIAFGKQDVRVNTLKKTLLFVLKNSYIKCLLYNDCQSFYKRKHERKENFEQLKHELIQKISRIGNQGKHAIMRMHHPFWGKMTYRDWDNLVLKYLDNHLNQFGV